MTAPPGNPRRSRLLEGIALLLLALSALLFQRSATAPWAEARASDGSRIQVSPIGVADYGLGTSGTAPTECRWWPRLGSEELCAVAPGGADHMKWLQRVYPHMVIALWVAVLAIFLNALRIPHVPRSVGIIVAMALPLLALMGMRGIFQDAPNALAVLSGLHLDPLAVGFGSVTVAAASSIVATVLLIVSGRLRRG